MLNYLIIVSVNVCVRLCDGLAICPRCSLACGPLHCPLSVIQEDSLAMVFSEMGFGHVNHHFDVWTSHFLSQSIYLFVCLFAFYVNSHRCPNPSRLATAVVHYFKNKTYSTEFKIQKVSKTFCLNLEQHIYCFIS